MFYNIIKCFIIKDLVEFEAIYGRNSTSEISKNVVRFMWK